MSLSLWVYYTVLIVLLTLESHYPRDDWMEDFWTTFILVLWPIMIPFSMLYVAYQRGKK